MNTKSQLAIAALIHDIGKLGYRAGEKGTHQEIGTKLIQEHYDDILSGVSALISLHHDETNLFKKEGYEILKKLVIADWLASSERIGIDIKESVKKIGLSPIFSKISIFPSKENKERFSYLGEQLTLDNKSKEIFPYTSKDVSDILEGKFQLNWKKFKSKFNNIRNYKGDYSKIFEFLFSLLKQSFKFVPSAAYGVEPDISLFDHSKIVCALAIAIDNYLKENNLTNEVEFLNILGQILKEIYVKGKDSLVNIRNDDHKRKILEESQIFAFIHGDFSGIQNFIHLITSKSAMKTLKGRSFFLSVLTDAIARYTTQELDLTEANILFAGGGHFYIISHNYMDLKSKIKDISLKANKIFIEEFNSNIYLALDVLPLTVGDLLFDINKIWREVNYRTTNLKKKKFKNLLETLGETYHSQIFGPIEDSAKKIERCAICNSFQRLEPIPDTDDKWCNQCKSFKDLSDQLKGSNYLRISSKRDESFNIILSEFNGAIELINSATIKKEFYSINNPREENTLGDILLPIAIPLNQAGDILTTDTLAEKAFDRTGFNKLGILKMDVDSLGSIIQKGLGINNTISRVSTLSTSLSLFFRGHVPKLIQSEFSDSIYLIFSGGDDLFAIGSWDKIIEFAYRLYKDFRRFTAFNPDITLSAGIIIKPPRYPIMKASFLVEDELEKAKSFERFNPNFNTKNKVSLLGSVLNWDWTHEMELEYKNITQPEEYHKTQILKVMEKSNKDEINEKIISWVSTQSEFSLAVILKDIFVYLIKYKNFSKSMLHKVEHSIKGMKYLLEDSLQGKIRVPKLWRQKYYLRSVLYSKDYEVKKLSNFIIQLFEIIIKNNLFTPNSRLQIKNIEFISVAVQWADYLTRI